MPLGLAFSSPDGRTVRLTAAAYQAGPVEFPGLRTLQRASGALDSFAQLCVRARLAHLQSETANAPTLEGEEDSPAHRVYRTFDEGGKIRWPAQIFGDHNTFQLCLARESEKGIYRVGLDSHSLPPASIQIWLNGKRISDSLERLSFLERSLNGGPVLLSQPTLRLSVLLSGELQYTKAIRDALYAQLRAIGYEFHRDSFDLAGPTDGPFASNRRQSLTEEWRAMLDQFFQRSAHNADLMVTIGTQATVALRAHYGVDFGLPGKSPPIVFLGVTYPVASHIVDSLYSRFEDREVAGVAYGADGLRSIAALAANWILPDTTLKFVYFDHHPQDREAAQQLKKTRLYAEKRLLIEEVTPETFAQAVEDNAKAYFSWYTIETIFESRDPVLRAIATILRDRNVIATTRSNCSCGFAFSAAAADDRSIGATGAEIIHGWRSGMIPRLGHHPIAIPRIGYWINQRVADRLNVTLRPAVIEQAWEVFAEEE